ncbi:flagellar filament capping protein FliD [Clostridium sp. SYSU_GA19001]|uniref:flagellar filament capping protein FliD n=1 Tax=Clostridium caldaquaticum TaxID=2940653 RepID=UPI0020773C01|nr:flagellar filament capping protein FliD [Clostridium caldaquaticum]MCM8710961.1 flagellar filament capping protein FliD [Clostridium caldaquaticum]
MSSKLRITGMATGLDVDTAVKQMLKAESAKIDKVKQAKQIFQWQQDLYREIVSDLISLRSTYFDVLKSDTNMLSKNNYAAFETSSSDNTIATASASTGAVSGKYTVKVNQLATSASITSNSIIVDRTSNIISPSDWEGKRIKFNDMEITLSSTLNSVDDIVNDINSKITAGSMKGKVQVSKITDGANTYIKFEALTTENIKITNVDSVADLDVVSGKIINPSLSTKLENLGMTDAAGSFKFTYNGSTVSIDNISNQSTLGELIQSISNKTSGNVTAKFSELTGKFELRTTSTGGSTAINLDSGTTSSLITALGLPEDFTIKNGQDAKVDITPPGATSPTSVVKSSNIFTIDNVSYNLTQADSAKTVDITVTFNAQKAFDKIKAFIDKYNEIVEKINSKIDEKKQYDYKPLTDDQKSEMKEDEIKKWEEKAKEGLLKNDSSLQNMLYAMRNAFFQSVEGAGITLKDLGLSTSSDISQRGKIVFNSSLGGEQKLKDMLATRGEQVAKLFMQTSSKQPTYSPDLTQTQRESRNSDQGIFQRINDILQDYVRTTRNNSGKKGVLIEKAGLKGDFTEYNNLITKQIQAKDKIISDLTQKLADKEEKYYLQFSKLETAMNQLNSQSTWLSQQLGMSTA